MELLCRSVRATTATRALNNSPKAPSCSGRGPTTALLASGCGALSGAEDYARAKLSRSLVGAAFPEQSAPFIPTHFGWLARRNGWE
ncbi:hypothetical protein SAMN05216559_1634 [Halomicrobium zhouii]|uniref:Uncharacterized protein n=1 Tax=Halomicrobium zhouii TaxID=767519 RepID=A0A1I6KZ82_9EURY|nr:hypothetical protein SAMN05216559_1634 [Halomicrobium zhouii]